MLACRHTPCYRTAVALARHARPDRDRDAVSTGGRDFVRFRRFVACSMIVVLSSTAEGQSRETAPEGGKEIQARSAWRPKPLLESIDVPRDAHHPADAM